MKIRRIELTNHPYLKNLALDFRNEENKIADTIILAGENGTGKTSILEIIYQFCNYGLDNNIRDEKRIIEVAFSNEEIDIIKKDQNSLQYFQNGIGGNIFTFYFDFNKKDWYQVQVAFVNGSNQPQKILGHVFRTKPINSLLTTIFSEVEINYTADQIKTVTAKNIDETNRQSAKSGKNLATEITQLIVDIQSLDAQEFSNWAKENLDKKVDETKIDVRIKRFTKAFDLIFPKKKFKGIESENGQIVVKFEENGKTMSINQLSSGEKQIVFRGSFLLKDKESNKGALIMIDEPEISLHPNWQLEILDFYKALFYNENGEQTSQILISTHSPFIVHNDNRFNDKVIVLSKNDNNEICALEHPEFYSWTKEKIVKEAFKIDYDFKSLKSKIFVEGPTDEMYFKTAQEVFGLTLPYDISWIGRINEKGNNEFTGDSALNHARNFFLANSDILNAKTILLYDSDTNKPEETNGNLLIRVMPINQENTLFTIGVENLLVIPDDFKKEHFYDTSTKPDPYGGEKTIKSLNKAKLCNWICKECDLETKKSILLKIRNVLEQL